MVIKDAVLESEKTRIKEFLASAGLEYEQNIDRTIYIEDEGDIVGTASTAGYIIKCVAVLPDYRGENLAGMLVGEILKRLNDDGIYYYQVFTKPEYRAVFQSFGFTEILDTDKVSVLEGGDGNINASLDKIKKQVYFNLGINLENTGADIACIVLNGDPFTEGHLRLAEYALNKHRYLIVFVLEEEGSYFSFKERYALVYLTLKPYENVLVLPSTKYIVSRATFPGYFLKSVDETTEQYAEYDATVFKKYFMPNLSIKKRYVGSENSDYMKIYNEKLKDVLGDKVEEVERFTEKGNVISAKTVRELIKEGNVDAAAEYIPESTRQLFRALVETHHE